LKHLIALSVLTNLASTSVALTSSAQAEELKLPPSTPAVAEATKSTVTPEQSAVKPTGWQNGLQMKSGVYNKDCDLFNSPRSQACIGSSPHVEPANFFEKVVMGAATLGASDGKEIAADPYNYFKSKGTEWAISQATAAMNKQFQKIPFLAQTTIGMDQTTGSAGSFYLDSLMKIATLGKDSQGDPKGLIFGQARWSGAWGFSGSTVNTGVGSRYRIGKDAMVGVNGFWDYRIVEYTSSHSRFGVGAEGFYKDLELRNNWYIAGTGMKAFNSAGGVTYQRIVPGWDVEIGYRLPNYPQLAFFLKGFNWDYVSRPDNGGISGAVNWQATPNVNLEASVSNEVPVYITYAPNSNNNVFVSLKLTYTFEKVIFAKRDYKQINLTRMTQPVRRRYDVLLETYTRGSGFTVKSI